MATDISLGFKIVGRRGSSFIPETILKLIIKDTETLTEGDFVNLESGEIDLAATNDTDLVGVVVNTQDGTDSVTEFEVYSDPDMVYAVYDPNVRAVGATLDIAGTTGAMTVAATSNADLKVVGGTSADEWTEVMINHGSHYLN